MPKCDTLPFKPPYDVYFYIYGSVYLLTICWPHFSQTGSVYPIIFAPSLLYSQRVSLSLYWEPNKGYFKLWKEPLASILFHPIILPKNWDLCHSESLSAVKRNPKATFEIKHCMSCSCFVFHMCPFLSLVLECSSQWQWVTMWYIELEQPKIIINQS